MQSSPLRLEVVEIRRHGRRCALAGVAVLNAARGRSRRVDRRSVANQTIVVGLLNPLVDDGSRPSIRHVITKDGSLVLKGTGRGGVAASLGEEDRDGVVSRVLLQTTVSRLLIAGRTTPLVGVQRVKVQAFGCILGTGHVILQHRSQIGDIGCRVTNGNLAIALLITVGLDVASSCQDIGGSSRAIGRGKYLISDQDASSVVELLKFIKYLLEVIKLGLIPVRLGLRSSADDPHEEKVDLPVQSGY